MSEVLKQKIRKDLSRWSRKLLLCIGLEDIGKQLVGEDKWQNLYPVWRDVEQERTPDFDPDEVPEPDIQDITSADLSHVDPSETPEEEGGEEKNEILENFIHLLPYWYIINRAFGGQGLGLGPGNAAEDLKNTTNNPLLDAFDANQRLNSLLLFESLKHHYAQAGVQPVLQNSFNHLQNLPFLPSEITNPKISNNSHQVNSDLNQNEALQLGLCGLSSSNLEDSDQPLDLTQKNKRTDRLGENRKHWSADVSNSRSQNATETKANKVSPRPNVRPGKGYTSQELEAALRDIQSGKLGTRRAAVIYGIPRSTLRNKVYKMGKDRSRPYFRQKNATNIVEEAEEPAAKSQTISGSNTHDLIETAGAKQAGAQYHNLTSKVNLPHTSLPSIPSSHSQGSLLLDGHRVKEEPGDSEEDVNSVLKSEEEISHEKKVLKEWLRTKLSRQQPLLHQQQKSPSEHLSSASHNSAVEAPSDSSDNSDVSRQDSRKEVILKIPSLINNKSSLSRVISRKKLKRRTTRDADSVSSAQYSLPLMTSFGGETLSTSTHPLGGKESLQGWKNIKIEDGMDSMDDGESEEKLSSLNTTAQDNSSWEYGNSKDLPSSTVSSGGTSVSDANGKKSRPKRGKYRNYDRDALLKAVRAVQNGEMSVHRAGSFYGVPHSTLEYKVKERHLLRRPKRKGTESPKPSHKSSPESSLSGSDPQVSRNTSGTPGAEASLPLTADLRESLSRYLNIGQGGGGVNQTASSSSGGLVSSTGNGRSILSHGKNQEDIHSSRLDNHNVGLGRGIISPFLNLFNLDDLIRQNLDSSSLLDLTKKS